MAGGHGIWLLYDPTCPRVTSRRVPGYDHPPACRYRNRRGLLENLVVRAGLLFGIYAAATVVMTWPVSLSPGSYQVGGGADPQLYVWTIGWDTHALVHHPWSVFDANIFFPHRGTLAYSENLLGSALLALPVMWLTDNALIATNLVAVLAVLLSALGGHLLARQLGASTPGAFLCGLIFAFAPPHLTRLGQLHLIAIQWVPFGLAFFHRYWQNGRPADLRWTLAFLSLQALTSGHGAVLFVLGAAVMAGFQWLAGAPLALLRRTRDAGLWGGLLLVPAVLAYLPYRLASRDVPLSRVFDDEGLTLSSYVSSPTLLHQALLARLPPWEWLRQEADAFLFPGLIPVLLALLAFAVGTSASAIRWRRLLAALLSLTFVSQLMLGVAAAVTGSVLLQVRGITILRATGWHPWFFAAIALAGRMALRRYVPVPTLRRIRTSAADSRWMFLAMGLLTLWLTVGPPLSLWQWVYWMPGLTFIRVPSRFTLLGLLALAVLAAIGFDRLTRRWTSRARTLAAVAFSVALLVESAQFPNSARPFALEVPSVDGWLATQPGPLAIAEVPVSSSRDDARRAEVAVQYMLHTLGHFHPTVFGYSGVEPADYRGVYDSLIDFPSEASLNQLADRGVTHVVVHLDYFTDEYREIYDARLAEFVDRLHLVHQEGDGRVYAIEPGR